MSKYASTRATAPSGRPAWAIQWSQERRAQRDAMSRSSPRLSTSVQPAGLENSLRLTQSHSRSSGHAPADEEDQRAPHNNPARRVPPPVTRHMSPSPTDAHTPSRLVIREWDDSLLEGVGSERGSIASTNISQRPRFEPSPVHEERMRRESIREPVLGGRSKRQQLGSVAESWGCDPTVEMPKGMFELDDDPPSDPDLTPEEARAEMARRAALGIPAERGGRPSLKFMEKERIAKLKRRQLQAERAKNNPGLRELSVEIGEGRNALSRDETSSTTASGSRQWYGRSETSKADAADDDW